MNSPGTLDDVAIGQLAEEPDRQLFPLLARAEAMVPLVVVLAFLPALYAVNHRTLTEAGAWEGLLSLRCLGAGSLAEFVDPAALDPHNPFRFQPPLMNWLTALSMRLIGVGNVAGRVAPAYLCTAGLIIAGYVLARRFGGEQLGLVTAGLLAFNPLILGGAQEPVPQSAACLLAVLALAGAVAHWQKSSGVASYQLLLGGLALGLCLLAGGPVALAVVLIILIYIAAWKSEAWIHSHWGNHRERSQFSRRPALRATVVLAATAFAVGGWHVLFMSARYRSDFWSGWWTASGAESSAAQQWAGRSWFLEGAWELNRLALPVFGMALLGVVGIVRDLYRVEEDPARQHRGLVIVWIAVALPAWLISGGPLAADAPVARVWETLLAIPVVIAAALGLLEIAERRVGFLFSLAFGWLALGGAALLADKWLTGGAGDEELLEFSGLRFSLRGLGILAVFAVAGSMLARLTHLHDLRRRILLTGMVTAIVLANCVWGSLAVRRTNVGDRELEDLRTGLARLPRADQCTFVAPGLLGTSQPTEPPAQLVYILGSLWPDAVIDFATSWEDAAAKIRWTKSDETPTWVFVAWSPRGRLRGAAPVANLKSATPPFYYHDLEIVAYVREAAPLAATD